MTTATAVDRRSTASVIAAMVERLRGEGLRPKVLAALAILSTLAASYGIVYATGGTHLVWVHLVYIPIILAAFCFGLPGGLAGGLLAGLAMGPVMPLNVATGEAQSLFNWTMRTAFFMTVGALAGFIANAMVAQMRAMRLQGFYNGVTGLPNRTAMFEELDAALSSEGDVLTVGRKPPDEIAVLLLQITNHDDIAATFGYSYADSLRRAFVERAAPHLTAGMRLYDHSNGQFGVIAQEIGPDEALEAAYGLQALSHQPLDIADLPIQPHVQVGIAQYPLHAHGAVDLIRSAIMALNESDKNNPVALFDSERDAFRRDSNALLSDLRAALRATDQLVLFYQPKISFLSGRCEGVEALIRWNHPERGMVRPDHFIPLAESTGLMGPLTTWVLRAAVKQLADWSALGLKIRMAANISVRNLEEPDFPRTLSRLLKHYGAKAEDLELEVTESALMMNPEAAVNVLRMVRELGVSIALDDFGTGQSSLSYLRDLPVDVMKLDQSFIRGLPQHPRSALIVEAAVGVARRLKLSTVGEGVEDENTVNRLRAMGCNYGQGYFFARPMPLDAFHSWLAERGEAPSARTVR